jgi:hypothetical protein
LRVPRPVAAGIGFSIRLSCVNDHHWLCSWFQNSDSPGRTRNISADSGVARVSVPFLNRNLPQQCHVLNVFLIKAIARMDDIPPFSSATSSGRSGSAGAAPSRKRNPLCIHPFITLRRNQRCGCSARTTISIRCFRPDKPDGELTFADLIVAVICGLRRHDADGRQSSIAA